MNANRVYSLLQDACQALDAAEDHAIAAHVGLAMALIQDAYALDDETLDRSVHDQAMIDDASGMAAGMAAGMAVHQGPGQAA